MNRLVTAMLSLLSLLSLTAFAQRWEPHLGLNLGPLLSRSLEATYELTTPDRNGAVFGNVAYTAERQKTAYFSPQPAPTLREFSQRTDGGFLKVGGKIFFNPQGIVKGFVGLVAVASRYHNQNRTVIEGSDWPAYSEPLIRHSVERGWSFAAGAIVGANAQLTPRFDVDLGVQVTRPFDQQFGYVPVNDVVYFRPGIGSGGGAVALQGMLTLKYRLGP